VRRNTGQSYRDYVRELAAIQHETGASTVPGNARRRAESITRRAQPKRQRPAAAGAAARALLSGLWRALTAVWEHHWPATDKSHSLPPPNALFPTEIVKTPFFAGIRISPHFSTGS
jgi:hypothetical protein